MGSGCLRLSASRCSAEGGNSKSGPKLKDAVPPMYSETVHGCQACDAGAGSLPSSTAQVLHLQTRKQHASHGTPRRRRRHLRDSRCRPSQAQTQLDRTRHSQRRQWTSWRAIPSLHHRPGPRSTARPSSTAAGPALFCLVCAVCARSMTAPISR